MRDSRHEAEFRYERATTLRHSGDIPAAWAEYQRSLRVARAVDFPYSIACAQAGLAACLGHRDPEAVRLRALAGDLFRRMGIDTIDRSPAKAERG